MGILYPFSCFLPHAEFPIKTFGNDRKDYLRLCKSNTGVFSHNQGEHEVPP
ncbi:MAG: hypothetical protein JETT_1314 [Candidatus Jettenia ecosi]|uniref:Uncharacterized protein n=1 Tax=Candidatus Jettenia ecosi TaxID=2494326 RepID=A0A533QP90_9BACT|nr:MAG: hypothetical protein JETT_1314 [Candidatus Jettenia ecosi]